MLIVLNCAQAHCLPTIDIQTARAGMVVQTRGCGSRYSLPTSTQCLTNLACCPLAWARWTGSRMDRKEERREGADRRKEREFPQRILPFSKIRVCPRKNWWGVCPLSEFLYLLDKGVSTACTGPSPVDTPFLPDLRER